MARVAVVPGSEQTEAPARATPVATAARPRVLVIEDDEAVRLQLTYALAEEFAVACARDRSQALARAKAERPDVVLLDLGLPPAPDTTTDGFEILDELLAIPAAPRVVVVSGDAGRDTALRAIELGAFDYHVKPCELETLAVILKRAASLHRLETESLTSPHAHDATRFDAVLGRTPAMQAMFRTLHRVARTDTTLLVEGEGGTGKELVAQAIHRHGRRRHAPFVAVNCRAIPDTLLEAEIFGHERKGKLELAHRGTLFLDEIGELGLPFQVKLLRFLQERTIERAGAREPLRPDVRVIAATNHDLKTLLERNLFREDLYYRLSVITVRVPPLRERGEDILFLADAFLRRFGAEHRRRLRFGPDAVRALMAHAWAGNVRELENKVRRAVIMARGRRVEPADLELAAPGAERPVSLRETRERSERQALVTVLGRHRGNITRAARDLDVSRPTLHSLLEKHDVDAKEFRDTAQTR